MMRILVTLLLLSSLPGVAAVEQFGYRILEKKPHDRSNWVQGLEIHDGMLYLSAGKYGKSRLVRYDLDTGELQVERRLNPALFAEGITLLGDRLYQLTWKRRMFIEFSRDELEALTWHPLPGQGWGLTNDGNHLIYTDGGDRLHYIDPETKRVVRSIPITENGEPLYRVNELEWVDGSIWGNVLPSDRIVIIDPKTGVVTASIDLSGLLPITERRPDTNILNGIARNPENGDIWVTGKYWPWLYRIELIPIDPAPDADESR